MFGGSNRKKKHHILVVEDESHLAIGIKYNLEAENYRVTTVGDGRSALQVLQNENEPIDLVILDLMLPGMSGYDVCESMRALGIDMPVLILSARTLSEDRTRGFDVGADQYLNKPFELEELLSRVKNLLSLYSRRAERRAQQVEQQPLDTYEFADAKIDFDSHEVWVHGEAVRLTQMEMLLLKYFIDNEGRVIPRSELLENVWTMSGSITTRAPDQFIRRLRKTFEPDPANPRHFLTIRDVGYRFVAEPAEK
ncbi:MAG: response regulator transcription factor [Pirellulaceae bacterium]